MIDVHFNEGRCELEVAGSITTLGADTIMIVRNVYEGIREESPESAELFKAIIFNGIETAFMSAEEMHNRTLENMLSTMLKGVKGHNNDDLINELKDLKKSEME
jgi:hypothetical protein